MENSYLYSDLWCKMFFFSLGLVNLYCKQSILGQLFQRELYLWSTKKTQDSRKTTRSIAFLVGNSELTRWIFQPGYVSCRILNIFRVNVSTIGDVMSLVMRSSFLAPLRISDSLQTRCGDAKECDLNKKELCTHFGEIKRAANVW